MWQVQVEFNKVHQELTKTDAALGYNQELPAILDSKLDTLRQHLQTSFEQIEIKIRTDFDASYPILRVLPRCVYAKSHLRPDLFETIHKETKTPWSPRP